MNRRIYATLALIVMIFAVVIVSGITMREKGWFRNLAVGVGLKAPTDGKASMAWITGPIVVNLPGGSEESVSRVNVKVETDNPQVYDELEMLKPKIRDGIIDIVSSNNYEEIGSEGSKQKRAKEIEDMVNSHLKTGKVRRVVFREYYFVPQP